ncbi:MAG: efflux transporter periplasmic adaptor subunit [Proteobacteria bacterium]|nr:efflux RND transporter periplasmic adaptor subunit [bacterium AH-315-G11]PCI43375.1 MAG: efflux transporter periplasmic adaptor subunit [Pseudomonadota bacterium]
MIIMLLAVAAVFASIIGYQAFVANMMQQFLASNARPPATVTAMQVERQMWLLQRSAVGTLRAVQGVNIRVEAAGVVKGIHFKSGDIVNKGKLLLELDNGEEKAQLKALQASRKLAEINYKRDREQLKIHAISQAQLDASRAELDNRKAQETKQLAMIAKKQIRAPFAGQLGVSRINLGQYLNVAEQIVSLQNTRSLYVDFNLPQKYIGEIAVGQVIHVYMQQGAAVSIAGKIASMDVIVDGSTRNILIEGLIDNVDGSLMSGMFVHVKINTGEAQSLLTVPQTSISYNAYGTTLFIANKESSDQLDKSPMDGKTQLVAQQRFVTTGSKRGDQVAIIKGLNEGDTVITSGQLKLKNGTPLIIDNTVLPANAAAPRPQEH